MKGASILLCMILFSLPGAIPVNAQAERMCDQPVGQQFDFWLGEWDLQWPGGQGGTPEGEPGRGTNVITKVLGECVIQEQFSSPGFKGMSLSTVKRQTEKWHQTWVDSQGGYLTFTGEFQDGVMELRTDPFTNPDGAEQINRMIWEDITADSLRWRWQRSLDDGETWEDLWVIRYARQK